MRTPLLAGNWKMNMTIAEGVALVEQLKNRPARAVTGAEAAVCPPFTLLKPIADALAGSTIALGAQDMFWEAERGLYRADLRHHAHRMSAAAMSSSATPNAADASAPSRRAGATNCCRRSGINDMVVNRKVHAAFSYGLTPIMCCGETLDERERGITDEVVSSQIRLGLRDLIAEQVGRHGDRL